MATYNLLLYTSKTAGKSFVANITAVANNWERTIRLQGGFWTGSFTIAGGLINLRDWYFNYLGYHVEERSPDITWEGYIDSMELDDTDDPAILEVKVNGYIFKAADRYVPHEVQSAVESTASDWFGTLVDQCDQDYLIRGAIVKNPMEVKEVSEPGKKISDELATLTNLGDEDLNFYRYYCTAGGRVCYQRVNFDPQYYLYSGMRRGRSLKDMINYVWGEFDDGNDQTFTIGPYTEAGSIAQYGRRELKVTETSVPISRAQQYVQVTLHDNSYPWSRPLTISDNVVMTNAAGEDISFNRWALRPGVLRDMSGLVTTKGSRADANPFLQDRRDIYITQVKVTALDMDFDDDALSNADMLKAGWAWQRRMYKRQRRKHTLMSQAIASGAFDTPPGVRLRVGAYSSRERGQLVHRSRYNG